MKKIILKNTNDIKNNKAITLIALVITIVILIILAAVAINLTIGENGIIERAKQAAFEMKKQEYIEELTLDMTDEKLDRIENSVVDIPLISGIKNRIIEENKDWIDTSKEIIMCDDDYLQHTNIDPDSEAENTILLIPIKGGYEARIRVNNATGEAFVEDIYKANYEEWNISYSANGGSGTIGNDAPTKVRKGFSFRLPSNTYTPPSMKLFVGWSTSADGKKNGED
jgi:competence protein ComGC